MKITKATIKAVLSRLFFDISTNEKGMPIAQPKQFTFVSLQDAASAYKKILEGSKNTPQKIDDTNTVIMTEYSDKEIEFTPAETVLLKQLFDGQEKWDIQSAEAVQELKDLFGGKETSQPK